MRITLKDHYANNWRNWRNYPRPIDQQQKNKLAKSLIVNGHIQVRFKKNTNSLIYYKNDNTVLLAIREFVSFIFL